MAAVVAALTAGREIIIHNDEGVYTFVNDTGAAIAAGQVIVLDYGADGGVGFTTRDVAIGAVGEVVMSKRNRIILGATAAPVADVAAGVRYTFTVATQLFAAGTPDGAATFGSFLTVPSPGSGLTSASSAQKSGGASSILLVEL